MWPFRKKQQFDPRSTYMTEGRLDWDKINTYGLPSPGCIRPALCDLNARLSDVEYILGLVTRGDLPEETNSLQPEMLRYTNRRMERVEQELKRLAN